jgi:hypothetical protein
MLNSKESKKLNIRFITIGKNNYKIKTKLYENLDIKISAEDTDSFEKYSCRNTASNIEYMTGATKIKLDSENFYELIVTSLTDLNNPFNKCEYAHNASPVIERFIRMKFTMTIEFGKGIVSEYTIDLIKKPQREIDRIIKITKDMKISRTNDILFLSEKLDENYEFLCSAIDKINEKLKVISEDHKSIQNLFKH